MKRFQGLLNRSKSLSQARRSFNNDSTPSVDSPEASAPRAIRLFCESGSASNGGEEVLHLPVIVEAAESSPGAAAGAAQQIRKFLTKEWQQKPHVQYNAIMLIRILSDNPGATFTRNFDKSFVSAIKETLRTCKDPSTTQILRESLDYLEAEKQYDEGCAALIHMWRKEKGYQAAINQARRTPIHPNQQYPQQPGYGQDMGYAPPQQQQLQQQSGGRSNRTQLPAPGELASRVEEARNTAKILLQLIQSTPTDEVMHNDLLREFNDRCTAASRSMQTYINCNAPPPDHDTMQTLIETNEQLSLAASRYQRAVLAARRALGVARGAGSEAIPNGSNGYHSHSNSINAPNFQTANSFLAVSQTQEQTSVSPAESFRTASPPHVSRNASPPQIPTTRINGFEGHGSYTPPLERPPQQPVYQPYQAYNPNGYQPQSNPGGHTSLFAAVDQTSNPFADPHDSSGAYFGSGSLTGLGVTNSHFRTAPSPPAAPPPRIPEPSQSFSIEPEPTYLTTPPTFARHTTSELENIYSEAPSVSSPVSTTGPPSPDLHRATPSSAAAAAATVPTTGISPSFSPAFSHSTPRLDSDSGYTVSPQASPPRPLEAQVVRSPATHPHDHAAEIDGHSRVGRRDRDSLPSRRDTVSSLGTEASASTMTAPGGSGAAGGGGNANAGDLGGIAEAGYAVSPIENRILQARRFSEQRNPRVDVPGTGGFKGFAG